VDDILDASEPQREDAVRRAAAALGDGEIVVLPTDTVYGVAADAFNPEGTARIFTAKDRPRSLPLPVFVRSPKQLPGICPQLPPGADELLAAYWPGPLTIVVFAQPGLRWELGDNEGTVSVRMPLDDVALEVISAVGPLAVTGANRSGQPPPATAMEAREQLGGSVRHYLDDGPRSARIVSTIVDLTRREPQVLREGAVPAADVLAVAAGELEPLDAAARLEERLTGDA